MNSPVLIVVDMLNDFLARWEPKRRQELVAATNELAAIFRRYARSVIWVRQEFEPDLSDAFPEMRAKGIRTVTKGTPGCEIDSGLSVAPSDTAIVKKRYSAFFGTSLDETLARLKPDSIVLAGINTHACIRTTAIDAYQRDWPVVLAADCIDSYDRVHHDVSMKYMKDKIAAVMTNAEIEIALQAPE
ncbi:MAG TPA: isochorismatase family cysteine hydrolase [Terracidiphilus sp.]|jgi:nicotinamidase-related amidase